VKEKKYNLIQSFCHITYCWILEKKFVRQKKNILTLVLSEKKILIETKNHNPPPLQVKWSVPKSMHINIIYMVSRLVTFKIMRRLKGCIGLHKNNLTKTRTKWRYGYCLKRLTLSLTYQWLCVRAWSLNKTYPVWETQTECWNDMRSLHIHLLWTGLSP
jgi:hypothetical protein